MSRDEIIRTDIFVQWAFKGIMTLSATAVIAFIMNISIKVEATNDGINSFKLEANDRLTKIETLLHEYSKTADQRDVAIREIQRTIDKK